MDQEESSSPVHLLQVSAEQSASPRTVLCCGQTVEVAAPKHNLSGVCPSCGANIRFKSMGRQKRIWIGPAHRLSNDFLNRNSSSGYSKHTGISMMARKTAPSMKAPGCFVNWDDAKSCQEERFYNSYDGNLLTPWKRGNRPRFSYWQENFDADLCAHLYTRNLPRVLAGFTMGILPDRPLLLVGSNRTGGHPILSGISEASVCGVFDQTKAFQFGGPCDLP